MIYLLLSDKYFESINPTFANNTNNTGNSKLNPKANIKTIIKERYSLTFASSCIGIVVWVLRVSNDKKNLIANGIIKKYASKAPIIKRIGVAIRKGKIAFFSF